MEDFVRRVGNKETLEKELTQAKALHEELEKRKGAFKAALVIWQSLRRCKTWKFFVGFWIHLIQNQRIFQRYFCFFHLIVFYEAMREGRRIASP